MADSFYTPQIDYRSRDFAAIRDDMMALIPNFAPQWTSRDKTDFGIVLIEMFAYMGDLLHYYIDRAANEGFLSTATQRDTVLNIARMLGYSPTSPTPATFNVVLTNVTATSQTLTASVTSPPLFSTDVNDDGEQLFFEYLGNTVTVSANATTSITLTEGQTVTKSSYKTSDGTAYQTYVLPDIPIIASSVVVDVSGDNYTNVSNIVDSGASDKVFTTFYDGEDRLYIKFGDNISGLIPPTGGVINVRYRKGGGTAGNVGSNKIVNVVTSTYTSKFSVNNTTTASVLGTDIESTDSVRINAPLSVASLSRAISLNDYARLAVKITDPAVQKAIAVAETYNSVILFVAGPNGADITSTTDQAKITSAFVGKTPPGTTLNVVNYTKAYPGVTVAVTVTPTATNSAVKADVEAAIKDLFSFDNVTFNDSIDRGDVYKQVITVPNVIGCTISKFEKLATAATPTLLTDKLYFYVNEIPTYSATSVSVTVSGGK